jgi:hypothetical protein
MGLKIRIVLNLLSRTLLLGDVSIAQFIIQSLGFSGRLVFYEVTSSAKTSHPHL